MREQIKETFKCKDNPSRREKWSKLIKLTSFFVSADVPKSADKRTSTDDVIPLSGRLCITWCNSHVVGSKSVTYQTLMQTATNETNFSAITPSVTWCNWWLGYDVREARKTVCFLCARLLCYVTQGCSVAWLSGHHREYTQLSLRCEQEQNWSVKYFLPLGAVSHQE